MVKPYNPDANPMSAAKFSYLGNCWSLLQGVQKFVIATDNDNPGGCGCVSSGMSKARLPQDCPKALKTGPGLKYILSAAVRACSAGKAWKGCGGQRLHFWLC